MLTSTPAAATWPSTIKICNSSEGSFSRNFDVDRPAGGGYSVYSNELVPGECTGNVNLPASVTVDLTDDGYNQTHGVLSAQIGIDADGIDDSQGPWDMPCEVVTGADTAVHITENIASHSNTTDGMKIRLRDLSNCGADATDHVRTCLDAASTHSIDVFKLDGSDSGTDLDYNNELAAGECTNWKDADGSNPMRIDLSDDLAHAITEWKINSDGGTWSSCERDQQMDTDPASGVNVTTGDGGEDYQYTDHTTDLAGVIIHATRNIRVYADGTSAGTRCGVSASGNAPSADANDTAGQASVEPTNPAEDPTTITPEIGEDESLMTDQDLAGEIDNE